MVSYRNDWSGQDSDAVNTLAVFPISELNAEEQCPGQSRGFSDCGSPPRMNACCFGLDTLCRSSTDRSYLSGFVLKVLSQFLYLNGFASTDQTL